MKLYVAVVKVDRKFGSAFDGSLTELKEYFDQRIRWAIGFRGDIEGSELVEGDARCSQKFVGRKR